MLLYKKLFLIIFFLISTNLFAEYEIEINFESGFEFKSQQLLIETLSKTNSKRKIEKVLISEDWIENYSIMQKPFQKKIFIRIKNREPILVLNDEFFYDKNLFRFEYDKSKNDIIFVSAPDDLVEDALKIIARNEASIKIKTIKYSHVTGWDIKTDKFLIKFGKDLTEKKFQNFEDTVNYLFEIGKNPSIIDIRYKDGAAIKYGK
jgi:cell division septal protein FtsQ